MITGRLRLLDRMRKDVENVDSPMQRREILTFSSARSNDDDVQSSVAHRNQLTLSPVNSNYSCTSKMLYHHTEYDSLVAVSRHPSTHRDRSFTPYTFLLFYWLIYQWERGLGVRDIQKQQKSI